MKLPERYTTAATAVAEAHGYSLEDLRGRDRNGSLSRARREAYSAVRSEGASYHELGRLFERDHSTIIAGIRKARRRTEAAK